MILFAWLSLRPLSFLRHDSACALLLHICVCVPMSFHQGFAWERGGGWGDFGNSGPPPPYPVPSVGLGHFGGVRVAAEGTGRNKRKVLAPFWLWVGGWETWWVGVQHPPPPRAHYGGGTSLIPWVSQISGAVSEISPPHPSSLGRQSPGSHSSWSSTVPLQCVTQVTRTPAAIRALGAIRNASVAAPVAPDSSAKVTSSELQLPADVKPAAQVCSCQLSVKKRAFTTRRSYDALRRAIALPHSGMNFCTGKDRNIATRAQFGGKCLKHGWAVSSVWVRDPPPPPPCPPGPLSYQGSIATGHTYGGAEGARKFFSFPLPT